MISMRTALTSCLILILVLLGLGAYLYTKTIFTRQRALDDTQTELLATSTQPLLDIVENFQRAKIKTLGNDNGILVLERGLRDNGITEESSGQINEMWHVKNGTAELLYAKETMSCSTARMGDMTQQGFEVVFRHSPCEAGATTDYFWINPVGEIIFQMTYGYWNKSPSLQKTGKPPIENISFVLEGACPATNIYDHDMVIPKILFKGVTIPGWTDGIKGVEPRQPVERTIPVTPVMVDCGVIYGGDVVDPVIDVSRYDPKEDRVYFDLPNGQQLVLDPNDYASSHTVIK